MVTILQQAELGFTESVSGRWMLNAPGGRGEGGGEVGLLGYPSRSPPSRISRPLSPHFTLPSPRPSPGSLHLGLSPTAQLPEHVLRPSHCHCCGALPSTPNEKGGARRFRRCGHCKSVDYCSDTCQRSHWKATHKQECLSITALQIEARLLATHVPNQGLMPPHQNPQGPDCTPPTRIVAGEASEGAGMLGTPRADLAGVFARPPSRLTNPASP